MSPPPAPPGDGDGDDGDDDGFYEKAPDAARELSHAPGSAAACVDVDDELAPMVPFGREPRRAQQRVRARERWIRTGYHGRAFTDVDRRGQGRGDGGGEG